MDDKVQRKIEEATEDLRPTWTKGIFRIMKRRGATKSRINYDEPNDDKVIMSSEYFEDDKA